MDSLLIINSELSWKHIIHYLLVWNFFRRRIGQFTLFRYLCIFSQASKSNLEEHDAATDAVVRQLFCSSSLATLDCWAAIGIDLCAIVSLYLISILGEVGKKRFILFITFTPAKLVIYIPIFKVVSVLSPSFCDFLKDVKSFYTYFECRGF